MTYWGEYRINWRYLAAASFGLIGGYSLINYVANLFTPQLIEEFGWTRSDIALVGTAAFLGILVQPIAGRMTDAFGVRRMATVGVICAPLAFIGLSMMTGNIFQYLALSVAQVVIIGGTTTAVVYCRLIAGSFNQARGMALAIAASMAPIAGAVSAPFLSMIIDSQGWRAGYVTLAVGVAISGSLALMLIPPRTTATHTVDLSLHQPANRLGAIFRNRSFHLIAAGLFFTNVSFMLQTNHLKVVLLDSGVDSDTGSWAVSAFAFSVVIGRLLCGVALDRFPSYLVTAVTLGIPAIGLGLLATGISYTPLIMGAVLLLGLALGAEGDVIAYVVRDYFRIEIFSTVLGLSLSGLSFAIALGSIVLSLTLEMTGSYSMFLIISAVCSVVGSMLFLLLGRRPRVE